MKRVLWMLVAVIFLCGCSNNELDRAMQMRTQLQQSGGCEFDVVVTADYSDVIYEFGMHCQTDASGNLTFVVTAPETIAGISGEIGTDGGKLTFDDQALMFELMADGQLTPVSAPWLLIKTMRSGYINACSRSNDGIMVIIDDSYADDAMQLNIWLSEDNTPVSAEILWDSRRILSLVVSNFTYM